MYQSHWGIGQSPFSASFDPPCYYGSPLHEEALARLQFLVDNGRRMGLLLGGSGTGKSTTLNVFARQQRREGSEVVVASLLGIDHYEFLYRIAGDLGNFPSTAQPVAELWQMIVDRVRENCYQRVPSVILLDDSDEAEMDVLTAVTRLAQLDVPRECRFTLVLTVQTARCQLLGPRLKELCELRVELDAWQLEDTCAFLRQAMSCIGQPVTLFDEDAMAKVHELTGGLPRRVGQLAELALLAGAGAQLDQIDAATVESAYYELSAATANSYE